MSTPVENAGEDPSIVEGQAESDADTRMLTDEEIDAAASTDPAAAGELDAQTALDVAPDAADQDATRSQDGQQGV